MVDYILHCANIAESNSAGLALKLIKLGNKIVKEQHWLYGRGMNPHDPQKVLSEV